MAGVAPCLRTSDSKSVANWPFSGYGKPDRGVSAQADTLGDEAAYHGYIS